MHASLLLGWFGCLGPASCRTCESNDQAPQFDPTRREISLSVTQRDLMCQGRRGDSHLPCASANWWSGPSAATDNFESCKWRWKIAALLEALPESQCLFRCAVMRPLFHSGLGMLLLILRLWLRLRLYGTVHFLCFSTAGVPHRLGCFGEANCMMARCTLARHSAWLANG